MKKLTILLALASLTGCMSPETSNALIQTGSALMTGTQPAYSSFSSSGLACFYKGERQSGFTKICFYDCLGSPYAMTIRSVEICPITVRQ